MSRCTECGERAWIEFQLDDCLCKVHYEQSLLSRRYSNATVVIHTYMKQASVGARRNLDIYDLLPVLDDLKFNAEAQLANELLHKELIDAFVSLGLKTRQMHYKVYKEFNASGVFTLKPGDSMKFIINTTIS